MPTPTLWAALLLPPRPDATPPPAEALRGVAIWGLQYTPRVAVREEAVLLELAASVRLFGGRRVLRERIEQESAELGVSACAWGPNSLAAQALARCRGGIDARNPDLYTDLDTGLDTGPVLADRLDALPMLALSAVLPHQPTLARLGCRTLGDVRRLPRGGLGRRFDQGLLTSLDQAYGLQPEVHAWVELPETFDAKLELMARVELAPALLFGARRLLLQLCGWLSARHCGVTAFTLRWAHDAMRSKDAGDGGELMIRTAEPTRDLEHLCRLLAENLAHTELKAGVGDLELIAVDVQPLAPRSASLLPDPSQSGESMQRVLERIAARLGPERVLRPVLTDDHRIEWMQMWQPAAQPVPRPTRTRSPEASAAQSLPQPTWLLPQPLPLATRGPRPMYQGLLQLLSGPHRVEGGWWQRLGSGVEAGTGHVQRDYWVALSEHAGVLWVFQERLADARTAWYLHGVFA